MKLRSVGSFFTVLLWTVLSTQQVFAAPRITTWAAFVSDRPTALSGKSASDACSAELTTGFIPLGESNDQIIPTEKNLPHVHIVVIGVGDVVQHYYAEAEQAVRKKYAGKIDVQVTYVDRSEFWKNDPKLSEKMKKIVASVTANGAHYIDRSDPAGEAAFQALTPDLAFVAVPDFAHVQVTEELLGLKNPPKHILIEKPLDSSLDAIRRLMMRLEPESTNVLAFDHYRARVMPSETQLGMASKFLGKGIKKFKFYFLEDHSSADPKYAGLSVRDGAIENEQREKALNSGVIMDGISHMPPLLEYFADLNSLRVTYVRAGQYKGVDGDPEKRTEIKGETFAEVGFVFKDKFGNVAEGVAYVGKNVGGVRELGPEYDHNCKMAEFEGINGKKLRLDLRSSGDGSSRGYLIDPNTTRIGGGPEMSFDLFRKPYFVLFEQGVTGTFLENKMALSVETGKTIAQFLEDALAPRRELEKKKEQLPVYEGGMKGKRNAPYLEDIIAALPIIAGPKTMR